MADLPTMRIQIFALSMATTTGTAWLQGVTTATTGPIVPRLQPVSIPAACRMVPAAPSTTTATITTAPGTPTEAIIALLKPTIKTKTKTTGTPTKTIFALQKLTIARATALAGPAVKQTKKKTTTSQK